MVSTLTCTLLDSFFITNFLLILTLKKAFCFLFLVYIFFFKTWRNTKMHTHHIFPYLYIFILFIHFFYTFNFPIIRCHLLLYQCHCHLIPTLWRQKKEEKKSLHVFQCGTLLCWMSMPHARLPSHGFGTTPRPPLATRIMSRRQFWIFTQTHKKGSACASLGGAMADITVTWQSTV